MIQCHGDVLIVIVCTKILVKVYGSLYILWGFHTTKARFTVAIDFGSYDPNCLAIMGLKFTSWLLGNILGKDHLKLEGMVSLNHNSEAGFIYGYILICDTQ